MNRQSGLSLLELAVYTAIAVVIGGPLMAVVLVSSRAAAENDALFRTAERNRVALQRISDDLRGCLVTTVFVSNGNQSLTLTLPNGFDGSNVIPGQQIRYELALVAGESNNGVDDNGNGLVDEGQLSRRNLTTGEWVVLCAGVDLATSDFSVVGSSVSARLTTTGYLRSDQTVQAVTRTVTVTPRN